MAARSKGAPFWLGRSVRLRLAARSSDLARIQAYLVGAKLKDAGAQVEYVFRAAVADQNLSLDLTASESKGLFTQDFFEGLKMREFDLVVHSWKDLPTEENPHTFVAGTLPRADQRDLLLLKKSSLGKKTLILSSSSPRRSYNLEKGLKPLLPFEIDEIRFNPVRGNIHTRIRKLIEEPDLDGLLVAKAAIDRLLLVSETEFYSGRRQLQSWLKELEWMVLPLSLNPTAAAQGALAIEVRRDHVDLIRLIEQFNCKQTHRSAQFERACLASHGGGCHQKIGTSLVNTKTGAWFFLRGLTDQGQVLQEASFVEDANKDQPQSLGGASSFSDTFFGETHRSEKPLVLASQLFPRPGEELRLFDREICADTKDIQTKLTELDVRRLETGEAALSIALWVAKSEALPKGAEACARNRFVWTAGVNSWAKLAARGVWVHGCADQLGEQEPEQLEALIGPKIQWLKLSHSQARAKRSDHQLLVTYQLRQIAALPDLSDRTCFFWSSGSLFLRALSEQPEALKQGSHWCGPGSTLEVLRRHLPQHRIGLALNLQLWQKEMLKGFTA